VERIFAMDTVLIIGNMVSDVEFLACFYSSISRTKFQNTTAIYLANKKVGRSTLLALLCHGKQRLSTSYNIIRAFTKTQHLNKPKI
jgi:hypothetical protein